jgi:anti-sigma regulatory factor (Ser/Thr protein kinase)
VRTATLSRQRGSEDTVFCHQLLVYAGNREFVKAAGSFIRDAVSAGEPILVMVGAEKIDALRSVLGDADGVYFADVAQVGRNPARIIPAWQDFVTRHGGGGRRLRGITEPVWPGRRAAEVVECQRHEALLNVAFADSSTFWLVCMYDRVGLDAAVINAAYRSHPFASGQRWECAQYRGNAGWPDPFAGELPVPSSRPLEVEFRDGRLTGLRRLVYEQAGGMGLDPARTDDLVLAVSEVAANSLRHGGGRGVLRVWREDTVLICEMSDGGRIGDVFAGRVRPGTGQDSGRGLWIVNQLCDLVQVRSSVAGTVIRLHMLLDRTDSPQQSMNKPVAALE